MKTFLLTVAMIGLLGPDLALGNEVEAEIRRGTLYVYGDSNSNSIAITSTMVGQIQISGFTNADGDPTNVNGVDNGVTVLDGWDGGVYVYLYDGDDELMLFGIQVPDKTHLDLGAGDDQLYFGSTAATFAMMLDPQLIILNSAVELQSTLNVLTVQGEDLVDITDTTVVGRATLNLGNGEDTLFVGLPNDTDSLVEFQDTLVVFPGAEADFAEFVGMSVGENFVFDDVSGSMDLFVEDTFVGEDLTVHGTSSTDNISMFNVTTTDELTINAVGGNDFVSLDFSEALDLRIDCGGGNDVLEISRFNADSLRSYGDGGDDQLDVSECNFVTIQSFAGAGNDTFMFELTTASLVSLYGDGGTDSLSPVGGNTFGELRLFSIENQ